MVLIRVLILDCRKSFLLLSEENKAEIETSFQRQFAECPVLFLEAGGERPTCCWSRAQIKLLLTTVQI